MKKEGEGRVEFFICTDISGRYLYIVETDVRIFPQKQKAGLATPVHNVGGGKTCCMKHSQWVFLSAAIFIAKQDYGA